VDESYTDDGCGIANKSSIKRWKIVAQELTDKSDLAEVADISLKEEIFIIVLVLGLFACILSIPLFCLGAVFFMSWGSSITASVGVTFLAVVASQFLLPKHPWPPYRLSAQVRLSFYRYFSLKVAMPSIDVFDGRRQYIFAGAPHGVFPFGDLLSTLLAPIGHINGLGAPAALAVPVMGNLLSMFGVVSCAKSSAMKSIAKGRSLGVMPGGISEIFETSAVHECAYIASRKGFCKLALESGCALVPCYTLGNTGLYQCLTGNRLQQLSNYLRVSITLFWGRFFLPIPNRQPVCFLMGTPIEVKKNLKPSQQDIDELHSKFVAAMVSLFEENKGRFHWEHKKLIIK